MTEVHEALRALSPTEHDTFPSSASVLDVHLASSLTDTHTLISSIPPPSTLPASLTLPDPPNIDVKVLQKEWKPVKLSAKDNPLEISVFKLPAKDGRGTWFARRSIHTEIPFSRFKAGLQREFQQPPKEDGNSSSAVRGIGKDTSVHQQASDLGEAEVLVLSAQFPGPSAPRVFVEGYLKSSAHPEDLSSATSERGRQDTPEDKPEAKDRPKQFTIISKPVLNHPEGGERPGYVMGTYESVEFIREVPILPTQLSRSQSTSNVSSLDGQSTSRPRGKTVTATPDEAQETLEHPPVEWIMVTRSDPGGSVPKWMVERGTPGGIVKDAEKFLKWCREADHLDETPEASAEKTTEETAQGESAKNNDTFKEQAKQHLATRRDPGSAAVVSQENAVAEMSPAPRASAGGMLSPNNQKNIDNGGLASGALNMVATGMSSLASSAIPSTTNSNNPTPPLLDASPPYSPEGTPQEDDNDSDDVSDTASIGTFVTALPNEDFEPVITTSRSPSIASTTPTTTSSIKANDKTPEDRALQRFLKLKTNLEQELRREEVKRSEKEKKAIEKSLKALDKRERKYRRAVEKADERKRKELEKKEAQRRKETTKEEKGRKEFEELKKVVEGLTKENMELRKRVEELEKSKHEIEKVEKVVTVEKVE